VEQDRRRIGNKEIVNEICPIPKREVNCCGTATPCLAYISSKVALLNMCETTSDKKESAGK